MTRRIVELRAPNGQWVALVADRIEAIAETDGDRVTVVTGSDIYLVDMNYREAVARIWPARAPKDRS